MITVYKSPPLWGLPSFSPPCLKLETWLRIANIAYDIEIPQDFTKAPKGKIPFIDYKGKLIGDSTLIIEMLKEKEGIDPDRDLTSTEKAISLAFRRMLKENTYWGEVYIRMNIEENWQFFKQILTNTYFDGISTPESEQYLKQVRQSISNQIYQQGIGRHSENEIGEIINADFQALSDYLADKPFFMGDKPTTLDATAYGYIANIILPPLKSLIIDRVSQYKTIYQYCERMKQEFFPDYLPS
ncbi:glutathione S-transferase family protein [Moorena sp. SIO3H5]|uniref:glutathione S-transferase family protein n=1 Tax=Moorena sp. SIO3H5 TaxID=2607834 RepID=UPI0013BDC769|nr:glutathione S-transferase family protein [Moorena sp. SIO3H5]NEO71800.1 glutathione S-transferase family protein [Moorena sp. SIO3H5]